MNGQVPHNLLESLVAFGERIGITTEDWKKREELEQLTYAIDDLHCDIAASLTLEHIEPLLQAFGDALTCRFLLGDLPVLDIAAGLNQQALDNFRSQTDGSPIVGFEFRLDKGRLIRSWLPQGLGYHPFLYLFPEALEAFLSNQLDTIEQQLWGSDTACKVLLLVPTRDIWLDGPYLGVLGGERLQDWCAAIPMHLPDAERPKEMYRTCRDTLKWQSAWLSHLTPLHLVVEGKASPGDRILNALWVHLVNLIILYTADRTIIQADGQRQATYAGAQHSVELNLGDSRTLLGEGSKTGMNALIQLFEWTYNPQWSVERLSHVQIGIAQALHAADPAVRYRLLVHNASNILAGLHWHWKAFIENKVDAYVSQVQALEDYVASTVQTFADQVAAIIKSLSDTMLAAVGALLGSFIAALFKDKFDPTIFVIGMLVYAFYVLLFPLGYNMTYQWQRYRVLVRGFQSRRERFEQRLYLENVNEIVGEHIAKSRRLFRRWFWATIIAYAVIIIGAALNVALVPGQNVLKNIFLFCYRLASELFAIL